MKHRVELLVIGYTRDEIMERLRQDLVELGPNVVIAKVDRVERPAPHHNVSRLERY